MEPTPLRWLFREIQPATAGRFEWSQAQLIGNTGPHRRPGKVSRVHVEIGARPEGRSRFSEARGVLPVSWFEGRLCVRSPRSN